MLTGRHVLLASLGFFGLIAAVNAGMIFFAVSTFSGLETENAYLRGLAYNDTLADAERQVSRGWTVSFERQRLDNGDVALSARFLDRDGKPLHGLKITAGFSRPTQQGHDFELSLAEAGDGRYHARTALPLPGQWDLRIHARRGGEILYTRDQRL